ncbi:cell wall elongation regulator TseB-like domain-containing protein [Sporosarcina gallistercoris]|uniref:DUF5590 domain-containing protein n=1 Tax=Sporosarcina gallistercoris TaxID=2762245 RepID=A0ABR8PFH4_9BACL|nr:DUF5590 domain-containing protein [Sporosarcina gallistercoris]MBD7906930.1 DUF5590 domain-containing protein [Sporosarcina gallistercoris]
MINWIKFFIIFLFTLTLVLTSFVFYKAYEPASSLKENATSQVLDSGLLAEAERAEVYNGTTSLTVVYGKDDKGVAKAVFVNEKAKSDKDFKVIVLEKGITAKQALTSVKQEMNVSKLIHVKLGVEDNAAVWEVVFKNEANKLNYVYVGFSDGQWQKRILNL